jgi:hypothetical protein
MIALITIIVGTLFVASFGYSIYTTTKRRKRRALGEHRAGDDTNAMIDGAVIGMSVNTLIDVATSSFDD